MKILSTVVSDHVNQSNQGLTFARRINEIPYSFKELLTDDGYLVDDGIGGKVIMWNKPTCMIFADAKAWAKRERRVVIRFSVLFFKSDIQLAIEEMGMAPIIPQYIDDRKLYAQLLETYASLGITNWVETGSPVGLRSIVAYQHGYKLDSQFNYALSDAIAEADKWLVFNLTQVKIDEELYNQPK